MMKRNDGFTLVELIITIAVATLITAAATSILVLGLRINAKTTDNVKQQNATNMLNHVVQTVAEGTEIKITVNNKDVTIQGKNDNPIIKYSDANDVIKLNGTDFMEDVDSFSATLSQDQQLLTLTLTTNGKTYKASTYCRLNPTPAPTPVPTPDQGGFPNES